MKTIVWRKDNFPANLFSSPARDVSVSVETIPSPSPHEITSSRWTFHGSLKQKQKSLHLLTTIYDDGENQHGCVIDEKHWTKFCLHQIGEVLHSLSSIWV
jgi:hypothetical protein